MTAHPITLGHQRSTGAARVAFALRGGRARLTTLRQQGSAKAIALDGNEIVFLNTSGGLTGGDRLDYALELGAGCRITATTQTAERVYRASGSQARLGVEMKLGEGAHLDWLPQETILFQKASARRQSIITLGRGATCIMAETLVLGRVAMGETVTDLAFHDWREIRQEGKPVHLEVLRLDADRLRPSIAGLAEARAIASVVMISANATDAIEPVRAALTTPDCTAAASAFDNRLVIRLMARSGFPLRRQLAQILTLLRRAPLPRVWQN